MVSSIDSPQENIGDELLCDENSSTDDNFENVEFDDDKISISSVEETSKMLAKRKFVPSKLSSFFNPVPKQAKTSFDHAAPSNPTVLTDAVVNPTYKQMLVFMKRGRIMQGKETKRGSERQKE